MGGRLFGSRFLLALAALFLMGGHPAPFGTLAFGCLFIAALLREGWGDKLRV